MRYELELEVGIPRERIVALMLDQANLMKWQPDLLRVEPLSGEPGAVGSKTLQVNRMGKRELEIVETVTVNDPPTALCATYESDDVWNSIDNRFHEAGEGTTRWVLVSEFRSTSIMMKLMTWLAPGMFKKQTRTFMQRFKEFAEGSR